ncbi:protein of unknown function [Bradyrhizobium vignae]|uniref:Uncharacterized protein n=1 Tax=Bradyrhizobium vignae TaxID=1549949 RepID=A0A2U3Q1P6_9BRAD|nr:protein of unknown function [Bradyrhizobium vignae]
MRMREPIATRGQRLAVLGHRNDSHELIIEWGGQARSPMEWVCSIQVDFWCRARIAMPGRWRPM